MYLLAYMTENFTCNLKVYYGIELKGFTFNVQLVMWMEDLKHMKATISMTNFHWPEKVT